MSRENILSSITYIDTERSIEAGEMKLIHTEYHLHLYKDALDASNAKFNLENVWDISYKSFSEDASLLYLHTHRGVITYKVHEDPGRFVTAFKKLKNSDY